MKKTNGSLNFEIIILYFWYPILPSGKTVTVTGGVYG